ncbi:MAG: succinate dehydrogenase [Deltaproteobacteria bacterium]|nr:succinate dehydrogenase [Deltaproteobacteria bacterium]
MSAQAPTTTVAEPAASNEGYFLLNRLGSVLAVAPLGVWTLIHIWNNLAVYRSPTAWQNQVTGYEHPYGSFAISVLVLLPLLFHTVWGVGRLMKSRPNNARYGYFDNLRYMLQRLAALGVFAFLGAHLWLAFLHPRFVEGAPENFADIAHEMHFNGPTLPVYLLGTLGVAYHLGNGIASIGMGWGLTASKKGMQRWQLFGIGLFVLLWVMSWGAIYGLWQAGATL